MPATRSKFSKQFAKRLTASCHLFTHPHSPFALWTLSLPLLWESPLAKTWPADTPAISSQHVLLCDFIRSHFTVIRHTSGYIPVTRSALSLPQLESKLQEGRDATYFSLRIVSWNPVKSLAYYSLHSIKSLLLLFRCCHVWLFLSPWTRACQAFLSFTVSWSLLKHMSIESVMPSNHLILCHPLLLLPSIFPNKKLLSH